MIDRRTRQQYLVSFLRGCADAADKNELHVDLGKLLVNGDLMREAADEFEQFLPSDAEASFSDPVEELHFNLVRAELHARQAHDLLYKPGGPKRSMLFRMLVGRAQSILMSLWVQELGRRRETT